MKILLVKIKVWRSFLFNIFLREWVVDYICGDEAFDLQSCRSSKAVLKYISKEDKDLVYNCRVSDLSFNFQLHKWCNSINQFSVIYAKSAFNVRTLWFP